MNDVWQWLLDFTGVHDGENLFSTRMYNFWSGFGGNISVLALGGAAVGVYRHEARRLERLNPLRHRRRRAVDDEHGEHHEHDGAVERDEDRD